MRERTVSAALATMSRNACTSARVAVTGSWPGTTFVFPSINASSRSNPASRPSTLPPSSMLIQGMCGTKTSPVATTFEP